jgi:penicillin-binding protein 1A
VKPSYLRWIRLAAFGVIALILVTVFALACTFVYLAPSLPTAATMHSRGGMLAEPMTVYTHDGQLVSRIGEKKVILVQFEDLPPLVVQSVLAAEDDQFFEHSGVDWMGLSRALFKVTTSGRAVQGGSTITQQAARQLFLSLDKTMRRKLAELFVTWRMERDFTKEQILATYLNVVFFGQRSYGIAAAADTFYNKKLSELSVAEAATLAGIIQLPSRYNPVTNPKATEVRRSYVIGRMLKLGYIDNATAETALREPVVSRRFAPRIDVDAAYVGELARQEVVRLFGEAAVNTGGYKVYTTLDGRLQTAANNALRNGLMIYDRDRGYRGRIGKSDITANPTIEELEDKLERFKPVNVLQPAIVTKAGDSSAEVYIRELGTAQISAEGLAWARGGGSRKASDILKRGDVVYVIRGEQGKAQLGQLPQAQAALVALDPGNGAVVAMVGGFDFSLNQFNRVTQAWRQPGSGFKPFLYSAALDNGFTPASIILDMPLVLDDSDSEEKWRPENSNGQFEGPMRLREGLVKSKNAVSARMLQEMGVDAAIRHAAKFGFDPDKLPRNLTLALGTQVATPLQMATGYAVFANGGFKVNPFWISRIEDKSGKVVFEAKPVIACASCEAPDGAASASVPEDQRAPRVLSAQNTWLISDIMHDVAVRGTGARTQELGRDDLAGKTGTTQESRDNWFNGFNSKLVATVWLGFDDERTLGARAEGSSTAVPVWNLFMREALKGTPSARMPRPDGLIDMRISASTGMLAEAGDPDAMIEVFIAGQPLGETDGSDGAPIATPVPKGPKSGAGGAEPLF